MEELSKVELEGLIKFNKRAVALFFYTPFCGTCKLASRMLEITCAALPEVKVYKSNVNRIPERVKEWQIESVPCIVILDQQKVLKKVYALHSVAEMYSLLKNVK